MLLVWIAITGLGFGCMAMLYIIAVALSKISDLAGRIDDIELGEGNDRK